MTFRIGILSRSPSGSITWAIVSGTSYGSRPRPWVALACGSTSTTRTWKPFWASAPASVMHRVVLPTPPLTLMKETVWQRAPPVLRRRRISSSRVRSSSVYRRWPPGVACEGRNSPFLSIRRIVSTDSPTRSATSWLVYRTSPGPAGGLRLLMSAPSNRPQCAVISEIIASEWETVKGFLQKAALIFIMLILGVSERHFWRGSVPERWMF